MHSDPQPQSDPAQSTPELDLKASLDDLRSQFQAFAYTVSHDLRAPLRHILAFTDLALEDLASQDVEQVRSHLAKVASSARLLGQQMDALMAWTQVERASFSPEPLNLLDLVKECCQNQNPAKHHLQWHIDQNLPDVWADAKMLRQVLGCLLSNAVKFTRKQAQAQVHIGWKQAGANLCTVSIRDNGIGFNPALQGKLFQVFGRLHSASEFEGVGMGLALTRRLLQRHGSKVWIDAQPQAGCTVCFQLPLRSGIQN